MKRNSRAFVNQLLICLLVTTCIGGSIGVGIVWMRHQISTTANTNRALLARVTELERYIDEKKTAIESAQNLEALHRLNTEFALGLGPVGDGQVVHATEDPIRRMVARANRELFGEAPAPAPVTLFLAPPH